MKLTSLLAILFTSFFLVTTSFAQSPSDQIKLIRKEFQIINSDTTLKKITLDGEDFLDNVPDGGAELSGYYKNRQIKKIYQWIGLSRGNEITEYYFKDGQVIFAYQKFESFIYNEKQGEMDYTKTKTTFEGRYYYNNKN